MVILALCFAFFASAADKYSDFQTLALYEKENIDYRIMIDNISSPKTVIAIHGGKIETGTSELLEMMSGHFNKYAFEGLKDNDNFDLHLTSTHFDEPMAIDLMMKSKDCLALHGYKADGKKTFCIGGANNALTQSIINKLQFLGDDYEIISPCRPYPGLSQKNIVNRCQNAGVQIEMNTSLRNALIENKEILKNIADLLSSALEE